MWGAFQRTRRMAAARVEKSDAELISEAVDQGRVTLCPPGVATGALHGVDFKKPKQPRF